MSQREEGRSDRPAWVPGPGPGPAPSRLASDGVNRSVLDLMAVTAALALAAVFTLAAQAKARRPEATADDFAALGLPWPGPLARVVPVVESATAVLLVVLPGWGGVVAFGLLAVFSANLFVVVRSGRVVSCACFGNHDRAPVTVRHLVRNGLLAMLALAAATFDGLVWEAW